AGGHDAHLSARCGGWRERGLVGVSGLLFAPGRRGGGGGWGAVFGGGAGLLCRGDPGMRTFSLLPPPCVVGGRRACGPEALLPGLALDVAGRSRLAELLLETLAERPDFFIVTRDDLPAGEAAERALIDGYGASVGDEVVEVRPAARPGEFCSR